MPVRITELSALPAELIDRFDSGDGLIWTGAGVSAQAIERRDGHHVEVGLPSAGMLQKHLEKRTQPHAHPETLAELAGQYVFRHGRPRLNRIIRAAYDGRRAVAPRFYDLLARLPHPVRAFVTTNYDPFLERSLAHRNPVVIVRDHGLERASQTRPAVYKPHGDASDPNECVIATADYDAWEQDTGNLPLQLATLYLQHSVVAVGYRARDDNFRRLLRAVNANIARTGGTPHTMYVVIPDADITSFTAYVGQEYDLALVRATGEAFLDWLLAGLEKNRRARDSLALSVLIDPPSVRAADAAAAVTQPSIIPGRAPAADVPDYRWLTHAESLNALAEEQTKTNRATESLVTRARAARAYRLGGEGARADALYTEVIREAVEIRRDAGLADRLKDIMKTRDQGVGSLPSPSDDETRMLLATADVFDGIPKDPPHFVADLEARLLTTSSRADRDAISYQLERLRAEHAVTCLDFERAAETYNRAIAYAPSERERAECSIRSNLFAGLRPVSDAASISVEVLRSLPVPNDLEGLKQRAIGWLSALAEEWDEAGTAFELAAEVAVSADEPVEAAICFRGAAWVDRHAPILKLTSEGPARSAYRLERSTASPSAAPRATLHGLLDQADNSLLGRKWHEAWRPAARALRMGFDEIDPGGVERAEQRLAKVWLGTIVGAPEDEYSLFWTAHFAARARPSVSDADAESWVQPLVAALSLRAKPLVLVEIIRHLANDSKGRSEMAGAMLLLADIATTIDDSSLSNDVVPLIIAGLRAGWGMNWLSNPAGAACRLLEAVQLRLSRSDAERIRSEVAETLPSTPLRRRDDIYIALAQAVAAAPPLPDGGADFASDLLAALEQTRRSPSTPHYVEALHLSLAAVAEKADEPTRSRIIEMFDRETHSHRWYGFSMLSARGISLQTEVIDRYIEAKRKEFGH